MLNGRKATLRSKRSGIEKREFSARELGQKQISLWLKEVDDVGRERYWI